MSAIERLDENEAKYRPRQNTATLETQLKAVRLQISALSSQIDGLWSQARATQLEINTVSSRLDAVERRAVPSRVKSPCCNNCSVSSRVDACQEQVQRVRALVGKELSELSLVVSPIQKALSQLRAVSSNVSKVGAQVQTTQQQLGKVTIQLRKAQSQIFALQSAKFIRRCRICVQEIGGQLRSRISCSGWSNVQTKAWTSAIGSDKVCKGGGSKYRWRIMCV